MRKILTLFVLFLAVILLESNKRISMMASSNKPVLVKLPIPPGFPYMNLTEDNPTTDEGIQLGRKLFFDPILDKDNERSCSSCHIQEEAFSSSKVNSLPHFNLVWNYTFLWDGKVNGSLEDIMIFEVDSFLQTDLKKLNAHKKYRRLFKKAFGVEKITSKEVGYALAQFERTLISSNSKYDRYLRGEVKLTEVENKGRIIYFTEKGDCFHCHGTILLTDNAFHNNGLDTIPEKGRYAVTNNVRDIGKFKSPTLRNIELTAPYMHDGRYNTIEEVIDFYSEDVSWSPTVDPLMKKVHRGGVHLSDDEKSNLISFLRTFTDSTFINNPDFSNPFKK